MHLGEVHESRADESLIESVQDKLHHGRIERRLEKKKFTKQKKC